MYPRGPAVLTCAVRDAREADRLTLARICGGRMTPSISKTFLRSSSLAELDRSRSVVDGLRKIISASSERTFVLLEPLLRRPPY